VAPDAHAHFSGKRQTERRGLDTRVELVGGGVTIHGRAVDVSTGGVAVKLSERTLQGFKGRRTRSARSASSNATSRAASSCGSR
jgi:hypothetical protein